MAVVKVVGEMWAGDGVSRGEHEGEIGDRQKYGMLPLG